jgi:hypothetical protein
MGRRLKIAWEKGLAYLKGRIGVRVAVVNADSVSAATSDHMSGCNAAYRSPQITGLSKGKTAFFQ